MASRLLWNPSTSHKLTKVVEECLDRIRRGNVGLFASMLVALAHGNRSQSDAKYHARQAARPMHAMDRVVDRGCDARRRRLCSAGGKGARADVPRRPGNRQLVRWPAGGRPGIRPGGRGGRQAAPLRGPGVVDCSSKAAAQAGTAVPAHGLIVESSFTTLADIARAVTSPLLPVFLLSQKFDSLAKVHELRMPVLFVHGAGDSYVPSRFSQELYQAAPEPKKLLLVDGATHNNCMRVGSAEYLAAIHELFSLEAPAPMRQARGPKS